MDIYFYIPRQLVVLVSGVAFTGFCFVFFQLKYLILHYVCLPLSWIRSFDR